MRKTLAERVLVLIGARGSGKSSVARALAAKTGQRAIDLDEQIELDAGQTIPQIFSTEGESAFREREAQVLQGILDPSSADYAKLGALSLGGGAVLNPESQQLLRDHATVVLLRAKTSTLLQRLTSDEKSGKHRPPLTGFSLSDEIEHILQERSPIYSALADFTIDTDGQSPDAIAEAIIAWRSEPS